MFVETMPKKTEEVKYREFCRHNPNDWHSLYDRKNHPQVLRDLFERGFIDIDNFTCEIKIIW